MKNYHQLNEHGKWCKYQLLGGSHTRSGSCVVEKNLLLLATIEPRSSSPLPYRLNYPGSWRKLLANLFSLHARTPKSRCRLGRTNSRAETKHKRPGLYRPELLLVQTTTPYRMLKVRIFRMDICWYEQVFIRPTFSVLVQEYKMHKLNFNPTPNVVMHEYAYRVSF
jgi:hypothetical protein